MYSPSSFIIRLVVQIFVLFFLQSKINAQHILSTTGVLSNNVGDLSSVTFNLENTNNYPIKVTGIEGIVGNSGTVTVECWYRTPPSSPPGSIVGSYNWNHVTTATITGIANTSTNITQTFLSGMSLLIPPGTTYQFVIAAYNVTAPRLRMNFMVAPNLPTVVISQGGVNFITGTNIGYGGGIPPQAAPVNSRGFVGKILFDTLAPCPLPTLGGNYTINAAQANSSTNFQSFTAFAEAIKCAGLSSSLVVDVVPNSGPYNEQVELGIIAGATANKTITIHGNNNTLTYNGSTAAPNTFGLNGTDYVYLDHLNIVAQNPLAGMAAHLYNNASNNKFDSCTFTVPANVNSFIAPFCISPSSTSINGAGFTTAGGSNNLINACTMNNGYYGISIAGGSVSNDSGNVVSNCTIQDFYRFGTYTVYNKGFLCSKNIVQRPTCTVFGVFVGIYVGVGSINHTYEKNRIRNPFSADTTTTIAAYGVQVPATGTLLGPNKFYNNLITDFKSGGIHSGFNMFGATYYTIIHNTVHFNHPSTTNEASQGIYSSGTSGNKVIRNNIFSVTRTGLGLHHCLYYPLTGGTFISNNNNLYTSPNGFIGYRNNNSSTLAQWQAQLSNAFDQQSISVDPLFVAPANGNYTPSNSLADNKGVNLSISTDILNNNRSLTTPDVGAYEFMICTGVNGGVLANSSLTRCVNDTFSLSVIGASVGTSLEYQWEVSLSLTSGFVAIPGANAVTLQQNVTQSNTRYYRLRVTCISISNIIAYSNVAEVQGISCTSTLMVSLLAQGYFNGTPYMNAALYNQMRSSNPLHCDSVWIVLHQPSSPFAAVDSIKTLITTDGNTQAIFQNRQGLFYIAVKGSHFLETWSGAPVFIIPSSTTLYNFTSSMTKAYGQQMANVSPGIFALYNGDINQDGAINLTDLNSLQNGLINYSHTHLFDINGDGNNDLLDLLILEKNIGLMLQRLRP